MTPAPDHAPDAAGSLYHFVRTLIARYERLGAAGGSAPAGAAGATAGVVGGVPAALLLAEAAMRYAGLDGAPRCAAARPLQIAVLGPTQAGKSTIVNLLLGQPLAAVSPLAGFTVHPGGFWLASAAGDRSWVEEVFPGARRCEPHELSRDRLDAFTLTLLEARDGPLALLPPCVLWDTPDFDSLAAESYERNVLETAALADAYVVVLSREKYSDRAVWRMLQLLEPLDRPLLICLNKTGPDAADPLVASIRRRLDELAQAWRDVPVVTVGYAQHPAEIAAGALEPDAQRLREAVGRLAACAAGRRDGAGVRRLIERHWESWVAPIRAEHAALAEWRDAVARACAAVLEAYRRDYLDHAQRYDAFRRATAELLELLELPVLGGALSAARQVVTWPARRLWALGRAALHGRPDTPPLGAEEAALREAVEQLLVALERDAARRRDADRGAGVVWRALGRRLEQRRDALKERFFCACAEHCALMQDEIERAAGRLYEQLAERPAVLAALRSARAAADAAGIALAVKTGGLHLNDLLFAPAMFGLVSLLTEGALGGYMRRIEDDLKRHQLDHVRVSLVEREFAARLGDLIEGLDDPRLFNVTAAQLDAATQALRAAGAGRAATAASPASPEDAPAPRAGAPGPFGRENADA